MHHPTDRITHTTAFVIPVVEHWLTRLFNKTRQKIYTFSIKLSFSSIEQDKLKLQKQISKLLILIEMFSQAAKPTEHQAITSIGLLASVYT